MKAQVRRLWECCFHDSPEFTELYFSRRYTDDVNLAIENDGEVIAALQMLPYPMAFCGSEISTGYISGACTYPSFRNQGVMRRLLSQALERMRQKGMVLSTLIPAEPWLFDYYGKMGYAPLFRYSEELFVPEVSSSFPTDEGIAVVPEDTSPASAWRYLYDKQRKRACCLLHTEEDFGVVLADLRLSGGHLYVARRAGQIVAVALASPALSEEEGTAEFCQAKQRQWIVGEIVADSPSVRACLLRRLCRLVQASCLHVITPVACGEEGKRLGMARILDAGVLLRHYAAAHPETEMDFVLVDGQLAANSGCYHLRDGHCMVASLSSASGDCPILSPGQLVARLMQPMNPYMSLMLN